MELKRVVVTGLGAITPVGNGVPEFWENIVNGVSGAAQGTVLKAVDKNGNGKIDAEDFGITKESMQDAAQKLKASANRIGESLNDAKTELDRRVLRPVFKEDLYPDSFSGDLLTAVQIPNMNRKLFLDVSDDFSSFLLVFRYYRDIFGAPISACSARVCSNPCGQKTLPDKKRREAFSMFKVSAL